MLVCMLIGALLKPNREKAAKIVISIQRAGLLMVTRLSGHVENGSLIRIKPE